MMRFTHYLVGSEEIVDGVEMLQCFTVGRCETCDRPVTEPNACKVGMVGIRFFLHAWEGPMPPEIWHDDELGQTICERGDCKAHAAPLR